MKQLVTSVLVLSSIFTLAQSKVEISERYLGFWSQDCELDRIAEQEAEKPPGFVLKKCPIGYEVWYARSSGLVHTVQSITDGIVLFYEDSHYNDELVLILQFQENGLVLNKNDSFEERFYRCEILSDEACWYLD